MAKKAAKSKKKAAKKTAHKNAASKKAAVKKVAVKKSSKKIATKKPAGKSAAVAKKAVTKKSAAKKMPAARPKLAEDSQLHVPPHVEPAAMPARRRCQRKAFAIVPPVDAPAEHEPVSSPAVEHQAATQEGPATHSAPATEQGSMQPSSNGEEPNAAIMPGDIDPAETPGGDMPESDDT